jgi:Tfp pilus assembly protein PilP
MRTIALLARVVLCAAAIAWPAHGFAQAPAKGKAAESKADTKKTTEAPPPLPQQVTPKADLPVPPPNFEYAPQGRRDPFVSLVNRGTDTDKGGAPRAEGVPGLMTGEITVRGLVLTRGTWVAMVAGPDGKIFTVRSGDRIADGVVRAVTPQYVVILQEVNDPLSLEKQREVRKFLRGGEEAK